jgi:hypothetical protein
LISIFLPKVKCCFDPIDIHDCQPLVAQTPTLYLYPVESLHITVATLRAFSTDITSLDDTVFITHFWKEIIQSASTRSDWPTGRLVLELEDAQLGSSAGILLWKETTGNMQAMRSCLFREVEYYKELLNVKYTSDPYSHSSSRIRIQRASLNGFSIPNIIHTSFLRFYSRPLTDGRLVQKRFSELLSNGETAERRGNDQMSLIHEIFKQKIEISSVSLVVEYAPYKLFPSDENQVLWDCLL